jgi:hypothetical protein
LGADRIYTYHIVLHGWVYRDSSHGNEGKLIIFSSISINANKMQSSASLQREFDIEIKLFQHSTLGLICFISSFITFIIGARFSLA